VDWEGSGTWLRGCPWLSNKERGPRASEPATATSHHRVSNGNGPLQGKSGPVHGAEDERVKRDYDATDSCRSRVAGDADMRGAKNADTCQSNCANALQPRVCTMFHALCLPETPFSLISCQNPYQSCPSQRQLHPSAHSCSDDVKPQVFASHSARPPMTPKLLTTCTTTHPRVFIVSFHRRRPRGSCVA
jgi:hypothetical protein